MKRGTDTLPNLIGFPPLFVAANYVQKTGLAKTDGFFLPDQRQSSLHMVSFSTSSYSAS